MSFTENQYVQIANNPRLPQCQTEPELLCSSLSPYFSLQLTFKAMLSKRMILLGQKLYNGAGDMEASISVDLCLVIQLVCTANEGLARNQYKCLVPIYVFPKMKLCGLVISKTEV
jgi:hypothetical protein